MPRTIDLSGQKFGKLTVLEKGSSKNRKLYWKCQCECGNIKEIPGSSLKLGAIKSCGCLKQKYKSRSDKVVTYRKRIKIALVKANGHRCAYCGLVDDPIVYDFHHIDPSSKSFGLGQGQTTRSKQAYADEAKKMCYALFKLSQESRIWIIN